MAKSKSKKSPSRKSPSKRKAGRSAKPRMRSLALSSVTPSLAQTSPIVTSVVLPLTNVGQPPLVVSELEQTRRRLEYYLQQKSQIEAPAPRKLARRKPDVSPLDKWIEIYSLRVRQLERQAQKLNRAAG